MGIPKQIQTKAFIYMPFRLVLYILCRRNSLRILVLLNGTNSNIKLMGWVDKLKDRWDLKSGWQVLIVLVVFACTGFTVLYLKKPIVAFFTSDGESNIWFTIIYYLLILPIYNVILLFYGFIFVFFETRSVLYLHI